MLIRRTLKFSILLVSMPCWSWWLIKSFAAPGWSSFETCPDPAGTIYFYFRRKKKITSKFFRISSRGLQIIITQADTSNILLWRFLLDEASRKTSLHISHVWSFGRPEVCRSVLCWSTKNEPNSTNYDPNYVSMTEVQNYRGHPLDDCQYKTYGRLE